MKKLALACALAFGAALPALAAPAVTFQRISHANSVPLVTEIATATISGTYATGGFTWQPTAIVGAPGTSPLPYSKVRAVTWLSPNGYIYVTTFSTTGFVLTATTKVFSAPGTELANGTAMPDATGTVLIYLGL